LYNELLGASIYVSDGIFKSISVVQYGETVTVENSQANFHLDENDDGLRLYVPRDENAREECFFRQLPRRLMTYFAISDPTAEALLNGVIGCRSLIAVDGILKDAGIVEVDGIERPSESDQRIYRSGYNEISLQEGIPLSTRSQTSQAGRWTPVSTTGTIHTAHNEEDHSPDMPRRSPDFDGQSSAQSSAFLSPPEESILSMPLVNNAIRETGYGALLERVINSAGRMTIPACRRHSVDNLQNALPLEVTLFESAFATHSVERDRKVGAAGELLVSNRITV
jgi:hypothetical protein